MKTSTSPRPPQRRSTSFGQSVNPSSSAQFLAGRKQASSSRILYLVDLNPSHKFGSLEEQIFLMASELSRQGGLLLPAFTREMPDVHRARYTAAGISATALDLRKFEMGRLLKLLRIIDRHAITIVHWNLYPPANLYVPILRLMRPRLKHFMTDHNSRPPVSAPLVGGLKGFCRRLYAQGYARVFAVSDYVKGELDRQAIWHQISRHHHFINTERFRPNRHVRDTLRASLNYGDRFIILVVAHLIREKGVDVAIRAMTHLPPDTILWVVGDGPERHALQSLTDRLDLNDRVRFFGLQSEVCTFMQAADLLVCPSVWQEAAGLVILEGLASGLPVVGSNIGGIPEFIVPDRTGYLFSPGNDVSLAEQVGRLYAVPSRLEAMRTQARAQAVSRFSHGTRVREAVAQYEAPS
jgi:glycosyltransferase involved in cell wall biosynthesis